MNDLPVMVAEVRRLGSLGTDDRALRWLRAAASTLADWGGAPARDALAAGLPAGLLSGAGSHGRSASKALEACGGRGGVALFAEIGDRAGEEDPGKIGQTANPALALVKARLAPEQLAAVLAAVPPDVAIEVRQASVDQPWRYRLIPQSYARPAKSRAHH